MTMNLLKRSLSLILVLVLLLGNVPTTVFATDTPAEETLSETVAPTDAATEPVPDETSAPTEAATEEATEAPTQPATVPEETVAPVETVTEPTEETTVPETTVTEPVDETDILMEPVADRIPVTSIEVMAETDCIAPGETLQLTATVLPENATEKTVIWSSEDESVLTVDEDGLVTGIASGCTFVVATAADGSEVEAQYEIAVFGETAITNTAEILTEQADKVVMSSNALTKDDLVFPVWVDDSGKYKDGHYMMSYGYLSSNTNYSIFQTYENAKAQWQEYGTNVKGTHNGTEYYALDISGSYAYDGADVHSIADGKVVDYRPGDGQITIEHKGLTLLDNTKIETWYSTYVHMQKSAILEYLPDIANYETKDIVVKCGQKIGKVGNTTTLGTVPTHLHFSMTTAVRNNGSFHWNDNNAGFVNDNEKTQAVLYHANAAINPCWVYSGLSKEDIVVLNEKGARITSATDPNANPADIEAWTRFDQTYGSDVGAPIRTITLDTNGGNCNVKVIYLTEGQHILELPTPTRSGYTFVGWFEKETDVQIYSGGTYNIVKDLTFYAQWTQNAVTEPYYKPVEVSNITENNALITAVCHNPDGITLKTGGFYLRKKGDTAVIKKTDNIVGAYQTMAKFDCSYNMKNEYGITLQSGTVYEYRLYVADASGKEYPTTEWWYEFKTTGTLSGNPVSTISAADYLKYYATVTSLSIRAKTKNGGSIQAWKLPWTDNSNSNLKLTTVSGTMQIKNKVVNHAGNIWYEYETGTGTRGFVYSGDITLLPYPTYPTGSCVNNLATDTVKLVVTWKNPGGIKLVKGGFVLKNSAGTVLKTVTENVPSSYQTALELPCSYEMKTEYGYALQPNTTYFYTLFVEDSSEEPYEVTAYFTTKEVFVSNISVSPANSSMNIGKTLQLSAAVSPSNASNKNVTWKSSNTSVATVSSAGVVTAKGIGTATITATAADGSGKTASAKITVTCNHSSTVTLAAVAPTCTATGLTAGKKCSTCGVVTVSQTVVAAKGHTEVTVAGKAATCTASGLTDGKKCSVCGTVTVAQKAINAKGHSEVTVASKAATCTEDGLTKGVHCDRCGETLVAQTNEPALGHDTGNWVTVTPATCTEEGLQRRDCSRCDHFEKEVIPANGHSFEQQDDKIICSACDEELKLSIAQDYVLLAAGQTLTLKISPADLADRIEWTVEGDEGVVTTSANVLTAVSEGTVDVTATIKEDGFESSVHFRVDVSAHENIAGIQLSTQKLTVELYSTNYVGLDILLKLPQNYGLAEVGADVPEEDLGVAIDKAYFKDDTIRSLFDIRVLDDRSVLIIPTDPAVKNAQANAKSVAGKYTDTIVVEIGGKKFESESLTLTVKKTLPKVKATVSAFNSFYPYQSQTITFTGATVEKVEVNEAKATAKAPAIPTWLFLSKDGTLALIDDSLTKSVSGKAQLLVYTAEWRIPAAVTLTVKNTYKVPAIKLATASVTVKKQDANGIPLQIACSVKTDKIEDLMLRNITASAGYSIEDFNDFDGTFTLTADKGFKADKIVLTVAYGTVTKNLTLTVNLEEVKLKLGATKVSLNKDLKESASVALTCTTKGYELTDPVLTYDSTKVDVQFEDGMLYVSLKDRAEYGKTYPVTVRAYSDAPTVTLSVAVLKKTAAVKSTIKATGTLDVIRESSSITIKPTYTNVLNVDVQNKAVLNIYSSADKYKEAIAEVKTKDGIFIIDNSVISDHTLKYKAQLETKIYKDKDPIKSNLIPLTVKMGTAKLTAKADNATMFANDVNDRVVVTFTSADAKLNGIEKVEIKTAAQAAMFELIDNDDGTYSIAFKDGVIPASIATQLKKKASYAVTLTLNIFIEGNPTTKANTTANVKLTIIK